MFRQLQDKNTQGELLALSPFLLLGTSFTAGLYAGVFIFCLSLLFTLLIIGCRNFIPVEHRLAVILIVAAALAGISEMILYARVYAIADHFSPFLPLLVINTLILSYAESVFSEAKNHLIIKGLIIISLVSFVILVVFGLVRELLSDFDFLTTPAACFFLLGGVLAIINVLQGFFDKEFVEIE